MEKTTEKNPVEEELYIEPNPTEEEVKEQIEVIEKVNNAMEEAEKVAKQTITHKWFAEDSYQQELIRYAYSIGWLDFVKLIECENGQRNPDRKVRDKVGYAYWLCQMNEGHHNIPEEYWKDGKGNWYYQIDYCYEKWKWGTKFYWPSRIVKGKKCANYVSNRFIIN